MDALQRVVATAVEAAANGESPEQTFRTVEQLALKAAGGGSAGIPADDDTFDLVGAAFVPRLTETWFC
jgi:hypothetical protein